MKSNVVKIDKNENKKTQAFKNRSRAMKASWRRRKAQGNAKLSPKTSRLFIEGPTEKVQLFKRLASEVGGVKVTSL